jgi:DNA-binding transcriptional ArsR family regulator
LATGCADTDQKPFSWQFCDAGPPSILIVNNDDSPPNQPGAPLMDQNQTGFYYHNVFKIFFRPGSLAKIYSTFWLTNDAPFIIFNYMVEYVNDKNLTEILKAVSDTTRRSLLTQLCQQGTSRVTDLANHYDMSLNAISKHIKVLEKAGLVSRRTIGRTHWIEPKIERVRLVENWFKELKSIWEIRLEKLDELMKSGGTQND